MSQYLSFKLVNKTNPDFKIDLGYWCSSIARGISYNFNNIFQYTESNIKLDINGLKSYINILHNGINEYRENLNTSQNLKKQNIELFLRADSQYAADAIKNEIKDIDASIADWEEEIDTWEMVENKLNFILDILEENKEEWELWYKNS